VNADTLRGFRERMEGMIRLSGEVNLRVASTGPPDDVARMTRAMLWLTLAFAFDGFVQRASKVLSNAPAEEAMKAQHRDWPEVLVRLKVIEQSGAALHLPGDHWEEVVTRHYLLRNRWAHNLGFVASTPGASSSISEWDPVTKTVWVSEAGWSEFHRAVENLMNQVLDAVEPTVTV
jgi:hypothetical protein